MSRLSLKCNTLTLKPKTNEVKRISINAKDVLRIRVSVNNAGKYAQINK